MLRLQFGVSQATYTVYIYTVVTVYDGWSEYDRLKFWPVVAKWAIPPPPLPPPPQRGTTCTYWWVFCVQNRTAPHLSWFSRQIVPVCTTRVLTIVYFRERVFLSLYFCLCENGREKIQNVAQGKNQFFIKFRENKKGVNFLRKYSRSNSRTGTTGKLETQRILSLTLHFEKYSLLNNTRHCKTYFISECYSTM